LEAGLATPEGRVKARVKIVLKRLGAYFAMPVGTGYGNSGVPDFLVCFRGWFIGVECKAGDEEPTALQMKNLYMIQKTGGYTLVVNEDNVHELEILLTMLPERK
jgi:hypothetical protein